MKRILQYFNFTQKEQRGMLVLLILMVLIWGIPHAIHQLRTAEKLTYRIEYFESARLENKQNKAISAGNSVNSTSYKRKGENINYFIFDPNGLSPQDWEKLGLAPKQIAVIKNYENKGGKFYKKEDLSKIYSISKEQYALLEPYIKIEVKDNAFAGKALEKNEYGKEAYRAELPKIIDINLADTTDFKVLKGIGSTLASRIVKYRNALGGFHSILQVAETYGLREEIFKDIEKQLNVNSVVLKKILINKASKDELSKHPYISYKQADIIINYRKQHGDFNNIKSMTEIKPLDQDFLRKIEPYLQF